MTWAHASGAGAWSFDPAVVVSLLLAGGLYAGGIRRLRASRNDHRYGPARVAAFFTGLAVVAGALLTPLDTLAAVSFSLHMAQHLALILVAAPLLVCGAPALPTRLGLPAALRRPVNRIAAAVPVRAVARVALVPLVVWGLHTAAVWAWHLPALYEGAVRSDWLHALEHAAFLGTAALFWSLVLPSPRGRRLDHGLAAGLVFITGLQSGALGVLLAFAPGPLYDGEVLGGGPLPDPLADQQLAGMLMWVPTGLLYLVTIALLLYQWIEGMDARIDAGTVSLDPRKN